MKLVSVLDPSAASSFGDPANSFLGHLDCPKWEIQEGAAEINIGGWIIPKDGAMSYRLRLDYNGRPSIFVKPDVPRPDVSERHLAKPLAGDEEFCGFWIQAPYDDEIRLVVVFGDDEILWKIIRCQEIKKNIPMAVKRVLSRGHRTSHEDLDVYSSADPSIRELSLECAFSRIEVIFPSGVEETSKITDEERKFFRQFVRRVTSIEFLGDLLQGYKANGEIAIPAPFFEGSAKLIGSFFQGNEDRPWGANYLVFSDGKSLFYVSQYLHSLATIYFPDKELILHSMMFVHDLGLHKGLIRHLMEKPESFVDIDEVFRKPKLGGLILNGWSPAHFFYDCMPALATAARMQTLDCVENFYGVDGRCFFPVEDFFKLKAGNQSISYPGMMELDRKSKDRFFISAGFPLRWMDEESVQRMDEEMCNYTCSVSHRDVVKSEYEKLGKCSPVLWIGVSQYKRAWANQISTILRLVEKLEKIYPKLGLVFDGLTADIYGESVTPLSYERDRVVVRELQSKISPHIPVVDIIGWTSVEKIFIAHRVNFFLASYMSGAMYPSRFRRLPGVGYLNKAIRDENEEFKKGHLHYDCTLVPAEWVTDHSGADKRMDFTDYSIDEEKMVSAVISKMRENLRA